MVWVEACCPLAREGACMWGQDTLSLLQVGPYVTLPAWSALGACLHNQSGPAVLQSSGMCWVSM